jgi:hypothetical protein
MLQLGLPGGHQAFVLRKEQAKLSRSVEHSRPAGVEKRPRQVQVSWMFPVKENFVDSLQYTQRSQKNLAAGEQIRQGFCWFARNL